MNNRDQAGQVLALLRFGAGMGAWLTPNLAARIMGLQPSPSLAFVVRLFGIREIVIAAGYMAAASQDKDHWLRMGIATDAADAVAALTAVARKGVPAWTGIPMSFTASGAAATGVLARRPD